jgi:hypothetical protein
MIQWMEAWQPYIWGYVFSLLAGHLAVLAIIRPLYGAQHRGGEPAVVVGYVERVLYTSAILLEVPSVIGFWLAIKVIGSWNNLEGPDRTKPRSSINIFLVGTLVSLLYGTVGGMTVAWWQAQGWGGHVPTVPGALVVGTLFLRAWIWWRSLRGSREAVRDEDQLL